MDIETPRTTSTSQDANVNRRKILLGLGSVALNACLTACGSGGSGSGSGGSASSGDSATSTSADGKSAVSGTAAPAGTSGSSTTTISSTATPTTTSSSQSSSSASKATSSAKTSGSTFKFGVFSGGFDSEAAEVYDKWIGRDSSYNVDFLTNDNTTWDLHEWAALKKANPAQNMLFSIPMSDMAGNVLGANDAIYRAMAANIKAIYPSAIIRIGWEMNGGWYAWSAAGQEALYRASFNHVAALFKTESPSFLLEWCPNNGAVSNMDCALAYPGDTYVDSIGMDTYMDYRYGKASSADRWDFIVNNGRGLDWQVTFAKAHGKLLSFPEWGVNSDDPLFVQNMYNWITTHKYDHASYWDSNAGFQAMLSENQYPNAAAEFKKLFGG